MHGPLDGTGIFYGLFFFLLYGMAEIEQSSFFLSPKAAAGHLMLPGGVAVVLLFF